MSDILDTFVKHDALPSIRIGVAYFVRYVSNIAT
jgi:hypothetical protein